MKPTSEMIDQLKIAAEAASFYCSNPADAIQVENGLDLIDDDVVPGIYEVEKRHKKLCNVLREALAWSKQDATNEDCFPSQDMLDARVDALQEALKLARQ
jgi:hypothetical protein